MECPFCTKIESDVIDSRLTPEKNAIRRRRRCSACAGRFTTYESTPEHFLFLLMKQHVAKGASLKRPETLFAFMTSAFKGLSEGVERLVEKVDEIEKVKAEIKAKKKLEAKTAVKAKPKKKAKAKTAVKAKPKKKAKAKAAVKAKPKKKAKAKAAVKAKPKKKAKAKAAVKAKPKKKAKAKAVVKAKPKKKAKAMPAVKVKAKKRAPLRKKIVVPEAKEVKLTKKVSATEEVLQIIKRHRKGVDITKLKNQTGFADSKLRMIVSRAYKQGKIKRIARGVYATA